jgi:hypothetical protein
MYKLCPTYQAKLDERLERMRKLNVGISMGMTPSEARGLAEGYPRGLDSFADTPDREGAEI